MATTDAKGRFGRNAVRWLAVAAVLGAVGCGVGADERFDPGTGAISVAATQALVAADGTGHRDGDPVSADTPTPPGAPTPATVTGPAGAPTLAKDPSTVALPQDPIPVWQNRVVVTPMPVTPLFR